MKIILKTFAGRQHSEFDANDSEKILDVKKRLADEYDLSSLKIVFKGNVLEDDKTLSECDATDGSIFVFAGKKKSIPKPEVKQESAATEVKPATTAESDKGESGDTKAKDTTVAEKIVTETTTQNSGGSTEKKTVSGDKSEEKTATAPETGNVNQNDTGAPTTSQSNEAIPSTAAAPIVDAADGVDPSLVDSVVAMGFEDRKQVALALRAAYMNVDRAVEYLCTGIPPAVLREITAPVPMAAPRVQPQPQSRGTTANSNPSTLSTGAAPSSANGVGNLRNSLFASVPNFGEIRGVYQENNSTLPAIMTEISQRYPELYRQIEANPQDFLQIMSETGEPAQSSTAAPAASHDAVDASGAEEANLPPVALTPEDTTAIDQLVELGGGMWDRDAATLVYLATQRNQEMAASVLFEHGGIPPELLQQLLGAQFEEEDGDEDQG